MFASDVSYCMGIDVGTTSIKAILLNGEGDLVSSASKEYSLEYGTDGSCEADPGIYWEMTCDIIRELLYSSGADPALIKGIAFSSQGETLIVLDKQGNPLRKAIIWLDNRSSEEAGMIEQKFGNQRIMDVTGQPEIVPIWPATRILWLRKHEPWLFKNACKFLLVEDYLLYKLTGSFHTEHSLVSSTLYFDIQKKEWWNEMLDFLCISPEQLPLLHVSGVDVGNLTESAIMRTGLTGPTKCYTGAYDHPAGAIGAGNTQPGDITVTLGASMAMCVALDKPVSDLTLKLPCQCHAVENLYFLLPYGQTAGMVLRWFRDEFCKEEMEMAKHTGSDPYDLMVEQAEKIAPGSDGLIMLPHLMGAGSPEFNPDIKGVFAGVTPGMTKGHFIRSIMESVVCMINRNLEILRQRGIRINEIRMLGGGSKSRLWLQMLADQTGAPVTSLPVSDNAAIGAALLAGAGAGVFKNLNEACHFTAKPHLRIEPEPSLFDHYKKLYNKYLQLYQSLEKFW